MNQSHQTILVASQPKLCDALSPIPRQIFGHISDETKAVGKTLAVREYIKNHGGLVTLIKSKALGDFDESKGTQAASGSPLQMMPFAVGESVTMQPASLDHPVHDSQKQRLDLLVGEHTPTQANVQSSGTRDQNA